MSRRDLPRLESGNGVKSRGADWVARQEEHTRKGVAIGAWRRYQAVGARFIAPPDDVHPDRGHPRAPRHGRVPRAAACRLGAPSRQNYELSAQTAALVARAIEDSSHKFSSAAIAIVGALVVGLNFGRSSSSCTCEPGGSTAQEERRSDPYAFVLLALYGLFLLCSCRSEPGRTSSWLVGRSHRPGSDCSSRTSRGRRGSSPTGSSAGASSFRAPPSPPSGSCC